MKFPWTHSVHKSELSPAPPEPKPEPKPEPTFTVSDLAERWDIDSLSAVKRITESDGFPREWGSVVKYYSMWIDPDWFDGYKPVDSIYSKWLGPDGHWLQSDVIAWEQSFYEADQKKREQAILKRELKARMKVER